MEPISRETFEKMDTPSKLNVLFDYLVASNNTCEKLEDKVEVLNRKALRWGGAGGVIAALAAYLASMFVGHLTK